MHALAPVTARDRSAASVPGPGRLRCAPARLALVLCLFGTAAATPRDAYAAAESPPELLASVAIGPASTLRNFAAYVDAVKPGTAVVLSDAFVRQG